MRTFTIKVGKVRFSNETNTYFVFSGKIMKKNNRTGNLITTAEEVVCSGEICSVYPGDIFEINAMIFDHKIYGETYSIVSFSRITSGTIEGVQKFLINRCPGLGTTRARLLTDKYGTETIDEIIHNEHALDGLRIGQEMRDKIHDILVKEQEFDGILAILRVYGIEAIYANNLYKQYGVSTILTIKSNPYVPFLDNIWPYKYSERIYTALKKPYNTPERIYAATYGAILWDSDNGGNLYLPEDQLIDTIHSFLAFSKNKFGETNFFSKEEVDNAIHELEANDLIVLDKSSAPISIYLAYNLKNENRIVHHLNRLVSEPKSSFFNPSDIDDMLDLFEVQTKTKLASRQREAIRMALTSPVSIITGGPGTGKTHTLRAMIHCIRELEPSSLIRMCAPTGKAATRAEELSGLPASTIHRMLQIYHPSGEIQEEDLAGNFLIIDEYSMVDAYLCGKLFRAANSGMRIVIVGDYNQLPSVGPGLVLRDFIKSGKISTVILNQIYRQGKMSIIPVNAQRVISAKRSKVDQLEFSKCKGGEFYIIEEENISNILGKIQKSVSRLHHKYGYDIKDIQVLTPVKRGKLGSESLNVLFQDEFFDANTLPYIEIDGKKFFKGDKVIHVKNNSDKFIFNGEVGTVTSLHYQSDHMLTVTYPGNKDVDYSLSMLQELELAYGLTVHKSQGSDFPVVIIPIHESIIYGINKYLIYTAITRARKMVIFIGSEQALYHGIQNPISVGARRSKLIEKIDGVL